ncbi:hypothetical protein GOAMR_60_00020 [Gordonia amarae NBRC 15530]|uniref:Uncharacterized protein n=2 Tax=Gordonia amarae TaxID=36821 RepID=G7GTE4_9ACTN|nr:hypothetical protein GOAMR_60_00020 [Gordonia amarae NBRC 15530]
MVVVSAVRPMRAVVPTREGGRMTNTILAADAAGSPILAVIVGCEIGFWVLVLGGLAVRYLLRMPGLSRAILLLVPLLDLTLLVAVALDLNRGTPVGNIHGLAGIYLGVTVAFGHSMIAWADVRFAHRFAGGPKPVKPPKHGPAAMRHELHLFAQWLLAAAIAAAAIFLLSNTVADDTQADDLAATYDALGIVTVIWLLTGPVWVLFSAKDDDPADRHPTRIPR